FFEIQSPGKEEMILAIKELQKTFTQGHETIPVIRDLNLDLKSGEVLAILGPSGSGKSTLLSLIAGLDKPDSGSIAVDGKEITRLSEEQLADFRAEKIGIIFQNYHLLPHLTALENVSMPLELLGHNQDAEERARRALKDVGLEHRLDHLP